MKGITLRHFPEIEPVWLEEFQSFLLNLQVDCVPLQEAEIYEELIMPAAFTVISTLDDFQAMSDDGFRLIQYGLLGLMECAFSTKQFGFYKEANVFSPAMPLGFFLGKANGEQVKLYFRNTQVVPDELEEGLRKLPHFLRANVWEGKEYDHFLGAVAFFDQHNWQFPN